MDSTPLPTGRVASLHLHPPTPGAPLSSLEEIHVAAGKGIEEDRRYFDRPSRGTGQPSRRQVTLIEREQIDEHAALLGLEKISPGVVRSNIETTGLNLQEFMGQEVEVGSAVLFFYEPRTPCAKMDAICQGLKELMEHSRQGVLAQVVRSGKIRAGDAIRLHRPQPV